jgi:hypothetical protein
MILRQDQRVVESQGKTPSYIHKSELLMRHDAAIKKFRSLWEKRLK